MKKIFKSITAVALIAAIGCTTAFASEPQKLKDSDFVKSYDYALHYRLSTLYFENVGNKGIYSMETNKGVYVGVSEGRNITATRLYKEKSIRVQADKVQKVVYVYNQKPVLASPYISSGLIGEYQVITTYPQYQVTPFVYDAGSYLPSWYTTKQSYSANKNGSAPVPVPDRSSRFYNKPYSLVFTNAPINFNAVIYKTFYRK